MTRKPRMLIAATIAAVLGTGTSGLALSQNSAGTTVPGSAAGANYATPASMKDEQFMKKAAQANMTEIDEGRIAAQKTRNPKVKSFAERMVQDHTLANEKLLKVARTADVTLPSQPSEKQQKHLRKLRELSAAQFDRTYDPMQVKDHRKTVREFEQAAGEIQNPPLKAWVHETLPVLRKHLRLAEALPDTGNSG